MTSSRLLFTSLFALAFLAAPLFAGDMPKRPFPSDYYFGDAKKQAVHAQLEGKPAPMLDLSGWMNGKLTDKNTKGKILVVDFWATWCGPCIGAIPHNNKIAKQYKDDVIVLGICGSRSGQEKMESIAKKHKIAYPLAKDANQKSAPAWKVMWWPTYAVVGRDGNVVALGLKPNAVDKVINHLLESEK